MATTILPRYPSTVIDAPAPLKKPKDFRPALVSLARYYARDAVRDQIRARGHKLSQYAAKDITALADQLLLSEPERFVARARKVLAAEIERKLLRTFAQNSQVKCKAESRVPQGL
jgi:hypothetical protein